MTLKDVSVSLAGRLILSSVSASFDKGMTAIRGPSGSGKTTLLAAISGRVPLLSGTVERSANQPLSWVFQSAPALTRRTVLDNVALGGLSIGRDRSAANRSAHQALTSLGIGHLSSARMHNLSGGERQRVAIARELVRGLDTVLADEPTAALDASSREVVCAALETLKRNGATVIIATHDDYVASLCDSVYAIEGGRLTRS